jgi:tRNA-2-methylthio-N6-dimethylallyladenosine synthase
MSNPAMIDDLQPSSDLAPKVFIQTYGCQMNEYDSSKMLDILHAAEGFVPTTNPAEATLLLLNTCSIREKAQEKVFSDLGRLLAFKEKNPQVLIGVGGCVASQEGEHIAKRARYVDIIFGPQTLHRLPELIQQARLKKKTVLDISFPEIEKFDCLPAPRADGPAAYVSIMEGCSKYCSYCVVPYTRGEEISRPFDDVLAEIVTLTEQGVKEIHLLGQNVNDYQGKMSTGEMADLALLIYYIAEIDTVQPLAIILSKLTETSLNYVIIYTCLCKVALIAFCL